MIMSVPASNLIKKSKDSGKNCFFVCYLFLNIEKIQSGTFQLDDFSLSFLKDNISTEFAKPFYGQPRNDLQQILRMEKIKNVTVVSRNGTIFEGFTGRYTSYEETETLCLSKGAKMPWFEMIGSQFSEPVWIKYV